MPAVQVSDTWQHDRPPAAAGDLAFCLDQDAATSLSAVRDGAEGPVLADHEVTIMRTAARAGRIARQRPRIGDNVDDLPGDADSQLVAGVPGCLAAPAVPHGQALAAAAAQDQHRRSL